MAITPAITHRRDPRGFSSALDGESGISKLMAGLLDAAFSWMVRPCPSMRLGCRIDIIPRMPSPCVYSRIVSSLSGSQDDIDIGRCLSEEPLALIPQGPVV